MIISPRLKDILFKYSLTNKICKHLVQLSENIDIGIEINKDIDYLDIAIGDPSKISYITKDRFKYFDTCDVEDIEPKSILFYNDCGGIPFLVESILDPSNKYRCIFGVSMDPNYSLQGYFSLNYFSGNYQFVLKKRRKYAFMIKPGKLIRKIFGDEVYSNKEIESFSAIISTNESVFERRNIEFKIVSGDDIAKYYSEVNYDDNEKGTLGGSCMRYKDLEDRFDIYKENGVEMLILIRRNNGKIIGRALIWPSINFEDKDDIPNMKFMDRVYTNNYTDETLFINYAKENKWAIKAYQSYDRKMEFCLPIDNYRNVHHLEANVCLGEGHFKKYPYLDTFTFMNNERSSIYNYSTNDHCVSLTAYENGIISLDESDEDEDEYVYSDIYEESICRDDAIYSEYHDTWIYAFEAITIRGQWVWNGSEDIVQDHRGRWVFKEDTRYSNYLDTYILTSSAVLGLSPNLVDEDYFPDQNTVFSKFHNNFIYSPEALYTTYLNDYYYKEAEEEFLKFEKKHRRMSKCMVNNELYKTIPNLVDRFNTSWTITTSTMCYTD